MRKWTRTSELLVSTGRISGASWAGFRCWRRSVCGSPDFVAAFEMIDCTRSGDIRAGQCGPRPCRWFAGRICSTSAIATLDSAMTIGDRERAPPANHHHFDAGVSDVRSVRRRRLVNGVLVDPCHRGAGGIRRTLVQRPATDFLGPSRTVETLHRRWINIRST